MRLLPSVLVFVCLGGGSGSGVSGIIPFLSPNTCERNACVPTAEYCSLHLEGVFRYLGPACASGYTCSDCSIVTGATDGTNGAVQCVCERLPFYSTAKYGQSCGVVSQCSEGSCYQPCGSVLFKPLCPTDRCQWDVPADACKDKVAVTTTDLTWASMIETANAVSFTESAKGAVIASTTPVDIFPITFSTLHQMSSTYLVGSSALLSSILGSGEMLFTLLDLNMDNQVSHAEYVATVPIVFQQLETKFSAMYPPSAETSRRLLTTASLVPPLTGSDVALCLSLNNTSPAWLVSACSAPSLEGSICEADNGKFYCLIDQTCVPECSACGWLTGEDSSTHRCVPASVSVCASMSFFYCASSNACVADCNACGNLVYNDTAASTCRATWWSVSPSADKSTWVCKYRKYANMACVSDMDCDFGQRKCSDSNICEPLPNASACTDNRDCALGYYCSSLTCVAQGRDGDLCETDVGCTGFHRCNNGVCQPLFSLPIGASASVPELCSTGQSDIDGTCTIRSPTARLGEACGSADECDCKCTGWWDTDSSACRRCWAGTGDLSNNAESLRTFLYNKGMFCHTSWTIDECLAEVAVVKESYRTYMCELQTLSGGITTLSTSSSCVDTESVVVDYCV